MSMTRGTPASSQMIWMENRIKELETQVEQFIRPEGFPKIVCLCGSGRFMKAFEDAEFNLTASGNIVLTIGCNTKDIARDIDWSHLKPMLDELHKRKIDLADEVLVLNVGGYIGESTWSEIEYARAHGKPVRYLETMEGNVQIAEDSI